MVQSFKSFVSESYGKRTTALLPATRALWNKNKVGVSDIANHPGWKEHKMTVQVAHVYPSSSGSRFGDSHKVAFVVGSGHTKSGEAAFDAHHDQTFDKLGHHEIVNTIHLHNGEIVHKDNDLHLNDKAPVRVYK